MFILSGLNNGILAYLLKIGPDKISPNFSRGRMFPKSIFQMPWMFCQVFFPFSQAVC